MNRPIPDLKKSLGPSNPAASSSSDAEQRQLLTRYEYDLENNKQNLGCIGKLLGNKKEKPGNVAAISIGISFILIFCIIFGLESHENTSKDRLLLIPSSIITLSLGYLFGKR